MLAYLERANRYSDHPAAVAEFLGLTKGTVSQSLLLLERQGYLQRRLDDQDRRRCHLTLTPEGRQVLAEVQPPPLFREAAGRLGSRKLGQLAADLAEILRALQVAAGHRAFGVCRTCRFFTRSIQGTFCGLTGEPLSASDARKLCRDHEAAASPGASHRSQPLKQA